LPGAADGFASLVVHDLNTPKLTQQHVNFLRSLLHGESFAVIARKSSTASGLRGDLVRDEFQGKSKAARRLNLAVQHLLGGDPREALSPLFPCHQHLDRRPDVVGFVNGRQLVVIELKKPATPSRGRLRR
jgi:hypothetical protein